MAATGVVALAGCLGAESGPDGASSDPAGDGSGGDGGDGAAETTALFGQSARFADSYAYEMRSLETGEPSGWSGRVDGGDSYM